MWQEAGSWPSMFYPVDIFLRDALYGSGLLTSRSNFNLIMFYIYIYFWIAYELKQGFIALSSPSDHRILGCLLEIFEIPVN